MVHFIIVDYNVASWAELPPICFFLVYHDSFISH